MGIDTISTIQGGYYGILVKQKNGFAFSSQGKLPVLEEILECIEDDTVHLKLSTPCHGHRKVAYIKHGDLLDPQMCRELADLRY